MQQKLKYFIREYIKLIFIHLTPIIVQSCFKLIRYAVTNFFLSLKNLSFCHFYKYNLNKHDFKQIYSDAFFVTSYLYIVGKNMCHNCQLLQWNFPCTYIKIRMNLFKFLCSQNNIYSGQPQLRDILISCVFKLLD